MKININANEFKAMENNFNEFVNIAKTAGAHEKNIPAFNIPSITRKWGSVKNENNNVEIIIDDELVIKFLNIISKLYNKFNPIIGFIKGMIPMCKTVFVDYANDIENLAKEYSDEIEYAPLLMDCPISKGLSVVYCRVKGESEWNICPAHYRFYNIKDEFIDLGFDTVDTILESAIKKGLNYINDAIDDELFIYTNLNDAVEKAKELRQQLEVEE